MKPPAPTFRAAPAPSPIRTRRLLALRTDLDRLYHRFNRPSFAEIDPIRSVRPFDDVADREVAGLVAALLAYGGLKVILASVGTALRPMGTRPAAWLARQPSRDALAGAWPGFRHRWTRASHLADLLWAVRGMRDRHGSLDAAFAAARRGCTTLCAAAAAFAAGLAEISPGLADGRFLPDPARGSACKRLLLYFRWMVRRDRIDRGGWTSLEPAELVLPLDVHTFRAARRLRLTSRRAPDFAAAAEATASLAVLCPGDPVRYDFALAHAGHDVAMPGAGSYRSASMARATSSLTRNTASGSERNRVE